MNAFYYSSKAIQINWGRVPKERRQKYNVVVQRYVTIENNDIELCSYKEIVFESIVWSQQHKNNVKINNNCKYMHA